jgi:hypothetical protein
MERCVQSARAAGVFKPFHILTDRPIGGCECYDAFQCDKAHGLFKLHYLKAGMTRLSFDYFVWIDADTIFLRNPRDVLGALSRSPIHVPLVSNLDGLATSLDEPGEVRPSPGAAIPGGPPVREFSNALDIRCVSAPGEGRIPELQQLRSLYQREGLPHPIDLGSSAFWIIHHDAIEPVYDLALSFWHKGKEAGLTLTVCAALSYAAQLLCADPAKHTVAAHPELWTSVDDGVAHASTSTTARHPAILHLRTGVRAVPIRSKSPV